MTGTRTSTRAKQVEASTKRNPAKQPSIEKALGVVSSKAVSALSSASELPTTSMRLRTSKPLGSSQAATQPANPSQSTITSVFKAKRSANVVPSAGKGAADKKRASKSSEDVQPKKIQKVPAQTEVPKPPIAASTEKPPKIQMLRKNLYVADPPRFTKRDFPLCDCAEEGLTCEEGSTCWNRLLCVECVEGVCPAGENCQNQRFQRVESAPLEIFKTENRGWGARAAEKILKGQFVIEYMGEIIDEPEMRKRMKEYTGSEYYFMQLDNNLFIDARVKANNARFLNHSCGPNCSTAKWSVRGLTRVGIFAVKDIEPGEELTYDYQYEYVEKDRQQCYCGAPNCREVLGGGSSSDTTKTTSSKRR
mmetsp:Transcript_45652/g.74441  ORF Transcript_45652/g.74441 Transcript_45652/m.74441 type:complete len:363 (+) Transcript_45652:120-1208(+)